MFRAKRFNGYHGMTGGDTQRNRSLSQQERLRFFHEKNNQYPRSKSETRAALDENWFKVKILIPIP